MDLKFTDEGDIVVDQDLILANKEETYVQDIKNRVKTDNPDWRFYPMVGSDLEDLGGMKNTRETGDLGVNRISRSLSMSEVLSGQEIQVRAVPMGNNEIHFISCLDDEVVYIHRLELR